VLPSADSLWFQRTQKPWPSSLGSPQDAKAKSVPLSAGSLRHLGWCGSVRNQGR